MRKIISRIAGQSRRLAIALCALTGSALVAVAVLGAVNWPHHYSEQFLSAQTNAWLLGYTITSLFYLFVYAGYMVLLIIGAAYLVTGLFCRWIARRVTHRGLEITTTAPDDHARVSPPRGR